MNYSEQTTPEASEVPRILFFDTNFFRTLLKGDFHHHMADPESALRIAIRVPFTPWRTAFSFMEWIGIKPRNLPRPPEFSFESVTDGEFIEPAYLHFKAHYENIPEIQIEGLVDSATKQRNHVHQNLFPLWDGTVTNLFTNGDPAYWLKASLSFDAVHKINAGENYRRDFHSELVAASFFGIDSHIRNLSKYRLAYRMWLHTREVLSGPGANDEQRSCIAEAHELVRVDNREDYLDGDLVHAAAYGVDDPNGGRRNAMCFTCDRPEVVIMRIRLYKGLLSYVRKLYPEKADAEGCPTDYESSHNGEVHCFDSQGKLVRRIDVATETPALAFLGKEPS